MLERVCNMLFIPIKLANNCSFAIDALVGIRDLVVAYPPLLRIHLSKISEKIAECMLDLQKPVRQALISLIKEIISQLSEVLFTYSVFFLFA